MKKIVLEQQGGGLRVISVEGDPEKETWGKIVGQFIFDYQVKGVLADLKHDKYKIELIGCKNWF